MFDSISMQDFLTEYQTGSLNIIDLRDESAFQDFHLVGAQSLPSTEIPNALDELDRNVTYYLVCDEGRQSDVISMFLNKLGYHTVRVIGGMQAYNEQVA